ncbi:MAG TPA: hypothetical protein VHL08_06740 [Dongiaceae bacterium]|jgi:hypothetical protein|nr:hypothetical protein [Dongiaceae bacterium]
MSILILNRIPLATTPYHEWLADYDGSLVMISAQDKVDALGAKKDAVLGNYAHVEGLNGYDLSGLPEWHAVRLHEKYRFKHVVALSEFDILRAARLREHFGISGQTVASAIAFRDKVVMKDILADKGLPVTQYQPLDSIGQVIDFRDEYGFPIVIKPRCGGASVKTSIINSEEELRQFLSQPQPWRFEHPDFMVEKYIDGVMYHIDGIVLNSRCLFLWPSEFYNDCLSFRHAKSLGSYLMDEHAPLRRKLQEFVRAILKALPTPNDTTFHAEVFLQPDGRLLVGEIASRTGGARIRDTIRLGFNINLPRSWIRSQCGLDPEVPYELFDSEDPIPKIYAGWLLIPPRPGTFDGAATEKPFEWVNDYAISARLGQTFNGASSSMDHIASFVVVSDKSVEVKERLAKVDSWFSSAAKWT